MTDEELKAEIKRRYPVDTVVDSLGGSVGYVIRGHDEMYWQDNYYRVSRDCALYDKRHGGRWAVVVKAVEPQVINQYEIY
jgi:hypothetical protein